MVENNSALGYFYLPAKIQLKIRNAGIRQLKGDYSFYMSYFGPKRERKMLCVNLGVMVPSNTAVGEVIFSGI